MVRVVGVARVIVLPCRGGGREVSVLQVLLMGRWFGGPTTGLEEGGSAGGKVWGDKTES